jgi:predicted transcriptional regulator
VATATANRGKSKTAKTNDIVLSIRLDAETVEMLDELAGEMERSRSNVAARAIREYVEREYATLCDTCAGEKDSAAGRWVSPDEMDAWLKDRIEGRVREPKYGQ